MPTYHVPAQILFQKLAQDSESVDFKGLHSVSMNWN